MSNWSFLARYRSAYGQEHFAPDINNFIQLEESSIIVQGDRAQVENRTQTDLIREAVKLDQLKPDHQKTASYIDPAR